MTEKKKGRTGRPPKENPKKNIWSIRFNDAENELLESLCKLYRNDNETKAETLERVVVYALRFFWKRFEADDRKRKQTIKKALDDYAERVGRHPVLSYEQVKAAAPSSVVPSDSPTVATVPTISSASPSVPASVSSDPSPIPADEGDERDARTSGTPSPLVPASLAGWFDDSSGGDDVQS